MIQATKNSSFQQDQQLSASCRHAGDRPSSSASLSIMYTLPFPLLTCLQQWGRRLCEAERQGPAHSLQHFAALCGQVPQHTISSLPATGTYQAKQLNTDNLPLLHSTQKWWTHHTPFTSYSSGMLAPSISKGQESSPQGSEVIPVNPKIPLLSQEQQNLLGKSLPFRCWSPHSNRITCCYNSYSARTGLFRTLHSSTENQTTSPVGHHLKPSSGHTGVTLIYIWAVLYNLKSIFCALRSIIASISHMKNRKWSIKVACLMSLSKSDLFLPIVTYNEQHR